MEDFLYKLRIIARKDLISQCACASETALPRIQLVLTSTLNWDQAVLDTEQSER